MSALFFETAPIQASAPNRTDIACFVGHVGIRPGVQPPRAIKDWLAERGRSTDTLLNVPVPIESWLTFHQLFDWQARRLKSARTNETATTYVGAAVRSFFAEGGRKCYVIAVDEPWDLQGELGADPQEAAAVLPAAEFQRQRLDRIAALIPGFPGALTANPMDSTSWSGVNWLLGLPDVSFLALPDLPEAVGVQALPPTRAITAPVPREQFVECGQNDIVMQHLPVRRYRAPRADFESYRLWARALECVRELLERYRRDTQFVGAVPLPVFGSIEEAKLPGWIADTTPAITLGQPALRGGMASAFIQLVYPWARTGGSAALPEALEPADGALVGVLARNAIVRGGYRSAAGLHLADVHDVFPQLSSDQLDAVSTQPRARSLRERVSIIGRTPLGMQLLSDVTMSAGESYRPAGATRLVSSILRAARRLGDELVFQAAGEQLWARMRGQLEGLMLALYRDGALRGATPGDAFHIRCDRTTMTQSDIDAGRVIAQVQFDAAAPIERITIVLALEATRGVTLLSTASEPVAA